MVSIGSLTCPRAALGCIVLNAVIYVVRGENISEANLNSGFEIVNTEEKVWTSIHRALSGYGFTVVFVIDDKLYSLWHKHQSVLLHFYLPRM